MNDNGQLALIDAENIIYEGIDEPPFTNIYNLVAKKEDVYQEHRLIKYKRDMKQKNQQYYEPNGHTTSFNCEMIVVDDIKGDLFKKWKLQEQCIIYTTGNIIDNSKNLKRSDW